MWTWLLAAALSFPDVAARDLDGRAVQARDLRGTPAVLALGFSRESRHQIEPWTRAIVDGTGSRLRVIVMPVYPGLPGPLRGLVDGAMASQTPPALRRHVWTTTAREELLRGLALPDPGDRAAIVLIDDRGAVRHLATGAPTPRAVDALITAWRKLMPAAG